MTTQQIELKWLNRIKNVLFCIDTDYVSYDALLSGEYDKQLRTHMDTDHLQLISTLSPTEFSRIKRFIDTENEFRKNMFS